MQLQQYTPQTTSTPSGRPVHSYQMTAALWCLPTLKNQPNTPISPGTAMTMPLLQWYVVVGVRAGRPQATVHHPVPPTLSCIHQHTSSLCSTECMPACCGWCCQPKHDHRTIIIIIIRKCHDQQQQQRCCNIHTQPCTRYPMVCCSAATRASRTCITSKRLLLVGQCGNYSELHATTSGLATSSCGGL